ncbi:hypothetical protein G6011_06035 [Alternaria panax]|uniref:Uncharacterized protein n=1 Tax=Alternaria panax TaxID=48097 RepID=A0AAD4FG22_9PLEO|nr:hypothetical protein G6011_06035 [Alternaria panax]
MAMKEQKAMRPKYAKNMHIDVKTPLLDDAEELKLVDLPVHRYSWPDTQKYLHPRLCVTHPRALAQLVARGIDAYFDHPYLSRRYKYGKYVLFERVRNTELSVDDEQLQV